MQKARVNKLEQSDFAKRALKRATKWYAREVKKPGGLSSYEIAALVKKEYDGVGPHAATIEILVSKASCFESNSYSAVTTKELDTLLQWYGVDHKGMKKADKVARWKEIRAASTEPPEADVWTAADEENLAELANHEIDISETYLGRYAALQKRNAVSAVLDFSEEEWESLKSMRESDAASRSNTTVPDASDNNTGGFFMENEMLGVESGAVEM
jgi:hypothetical protein